MLWTAISWALWLGFALVLLVFSLVGLLYSYWRTRVFLERKSIYNVENGRPITTTPLSFPFGFETIPDRRHFHQVIAEISSRYGDDDVCRLHALWRQIVIVGDPNMMVDIAKQKFVLRHNKGILFTNDVEHWRQRRHVALQGMMKTTHLRKICGWTTETALTLFEHWSSRVDSASSVDLDISDEMSKVGMDVIGKAAFSVDLMAAKNNPETQQLREDVYQVMEGSDKFNLLPRWLFGLLKMIPPQFIIDHGPSEASKSEGAFQNLVNFVLHLIEERRQQRKSDEDDPNDILSMLLDYEEKKDRPDDAAIAFTCWDLFLAGHETTGHTMAWALLMLAENMEKQQRVQREVDEVMGDDGVVRFDARNKFPYLSCIIKETLRLYPTVPLFTKLTDESCVVGKYHLPAKTPILISSYRLHRHPKFWSDPEKFLPERWERQTQTTNGETEKEDDTTLYHPGAYFPFGTGPRQCIGMRMAQLEATMVLAMILHRYDVRRLPGEEGKDVDGEYTVTLHPIKLKLRFTKRDKKGVA